MSEEEQVRVNFLVEKSLHEKVKAKAKKDDRSLSSFIRLLLVKEVEDSQETERL